MINDHTSQHIYKDEKEIIVAKISRILSRYIEVIFAYLYGPFVEQESSWKINLGIFLKERVTPPTYWKYEEIMTEDINNKLHLPIKTEVKIINLESTSFLFQVIRGKPIFVKNESFLNDFMLNVTRSYLDLQNKCHRNIAYARGGGPLDKLMKTNMSSSLEQIRESSMRLKEQANIPLHEFLSDRDKQDIATLALILAIESLIEICLYLSIAKFKKVPQDYGECLYILTVHEIIDNDLTYHLGEFLDLREILLQGRRKIDYVKLHSIISGERLGILDEFAGNIAAKLREFGYI